MSSSFRGAVAPSTSERRIADDDRRSDVRVLLVTVLLIFVFFGVATVPQIAVQSGQAASGSALVELIVVRIAVNLIVFVVCAILLVVLHPVDHRGSRLVGDVLLIAIVAVLVRVPVQVIRGVYTVDRWQEALVESDRLPSRARRRRHRRASRANA